MYYERKGGPGDGRFLMHHDDGLSPLPPWLESLCLLDQARFSGDCLMVRAYTGNWRTIGSDHVVLYSDTYGLWEMSYNDFKEHFYVSSSSPT